MNTNIVEIKVKNQSIIRTRPLYQWDSGQILKVIDQGIPDNTEVQFGSACMQPSVSAFMANNQVKIPQAAMEQPMEIIAYMVIVEPDSETTVKEIRIPMRPKPKPSDYVPEEDVPSIMQVIQMKADKGGWTPNMYLGTDAEGNMVEKDAPSGGETTVPTKLSDLGSDSLHRTVTDEEKAAWNAKSNFSGSYNDLTEKPTIPTVPTDISAFNNDKGYLTGETDPTVPTWAKASEKPTYTAEEVGARPSTWTPSASEVGADPSGTAAASVSSHNTAEDAHADIRLLVAGLTARLNALADSDDETLDQVSELVAYIKANRSLIEQITTGKVSVTDIINNLTTNISDKPLSAAQGVVLKGLIDALQAAVNAAAKAIDLTSHTGNTTAHITAAERTKWNQAVTDVGNLSEEIADQYAKKSAIPTKVSQLTNDSGYLTQHQDVSGKEDKSNKVTSLSASSTDQQYPSAKCVYDLINQIGSQTPEFANSIEECTDTSKLYVLPDGYVYAFRSATTTEEVTITDNIVGTEDNPYQVGRIPSSGTTPSSAPGYIISPWIDLTKAEYVGKTIKLHFEGLRYITETYETYVQNQVLATDGTILAQRAYSCLDSNGNLPVLSDNVEILDTTSAVLTLNIPKTYGTSGKQVGNVRFSAAGTESDSNIYITYTTTQTVTGEQWVNTGVQYGGSGLDEQTAAKISGLNNEGADPSVIKLLSAPVLDFYNSDAYPDDDYTVSHLSKITYPCRADVPVPFLAKWSHNENAMRTTLVVDTKAIGTVNPYRMRIYDVTGFDSYPVYNLLPNTTYYYKVTHVLSDGSLVEAKSGSFATSNETFRLLYIEGTQNVRDLGGWTGFEGKKVKYGKIIRGAALSDSTGSNLIVTGKGRLALGELKIQAELNLGAIDNETSIAANCAYKKIGYNNYAGAITGEVYRAQFKEALEWIVSCLDGTLAQTGLYTVERNVYMHCQGGCDRTGTLSFQLLGLLGVSESDLAKEYELSSFSDVGFGRLRTTTKAVDTYDYVGMVEAIKAYSGATITDKFYNFAIDCGISADTITAFRNLMLE